MEIEKLALLDFFYLYTYRWTTFGISSYVKSCVGYANILAFLAHLDRRPAKKPLSLYLSEAQVRHDEIKKWPTYLAIDAASVPL